MAKTRLPEAIALATFNDTAGNRIVTGKAIIRCTARIAGTIANALATASHEIQATPCYRDFDVFGKEYWKPVSDYQTHFHNETET